MDKDEIKVQKALGIMKITQVEIIGEEYRVDLQDTVNIFLEEKQLSIDEVNIQYDALCKSGGAMFYSVCITYLKEV